MSTSLKDLCSKCPHRDTCIELCPKAERYVNKDHVSQREIPMPEYKLELFNVHKKIIPIKEQIQDYNFALASLTDLQKKCLTLFYDRGLSYKQIAFRLSSANQYGVFQQLSSRSVKYQLAKARAEILSFFSHYRGE